jgi:prepilin-type processing-associated H-X9-DG protein
MKTRWGSLLLAVLFPSTLFAQALADRVPADATVYIGWKGTDDPGPAYAGSHLKALLDSSDFSTYAHEAFPALLKKLETLNPQAALAVEPILNLGGPLLRHPSAIYVGAIDPAGSPPHVAILCQAGATAADLETWLTQQAANLPVPIAISRFDDIVALTFGFSDKFALPAANDALAADPTFRQTIAQLGADPVLAGYINVEALDAVIDKHMQGGGDPGQAAGWNSIRKSLGLANIQRVAFTAGFDGREWTDQAIVTPRPGKTLSTVDATPLPEELLTVVPKTATYMVAMRMDLARIINSTIASATSSDPNAAAQVDDAMNKFAEATGVNPRKDLLPIFGDEWVIYADPAVNGRGLGSIAIVNHLKKPEQAQDILDRVAAGAQKALAEQIQNPAIHIGFQKTQIGQTQVSYLAIPIITPSWTVQGDDLCIAFYPQVAASAAAQIAGKGESILDNPDFITLRKQLGDKPAYTVRFQDLKAEIPDTYSSWRSIASATQIGSVLGVDTPPNLLPPFPVLMAHLAPTGAVAWSDAQGIHMRDISPFPGAEVLGTDIGSIGVAESALGVSILLPALNRAREQANRVKSASNLRQIGLGGLMYANDHRGKLPDSLGKMIAEEDLTPQVFVNPRTGSPPPPPDLPKEQWPQWVDEHSDYVWLGRGKTSAAPADAVLAYEKFDGLKDGVNILYGDGHVEFQLMANAHQQIDAAQPPANGGL